MTNETITNTNQDLIDVLNALIDMGREGDGYVPQEWRTLVGALCDAVGIVNSQRLYLMDPDHPVVGAIEV